MAVGKKTILVVSDRLGPGGAEKNLALIGRHADRGVFNIRYLLTVQREKLPMDTFGSEIPVFYLHVPQVRMNIFTWFINLAFRIFFVTIWLGIHGREADYAIASSLQEEIGVYCAKRILGLRYKFIVFNQMFHSITEGEVDLFSKLFTHRLGTWMNRVCDGRICLSQGIADGPARENRPTAAIVICPSCVDPEEIRRNRGGKLDEDWLHEDSRKTILYAGRMVNRQKRIDLILRAASLLRGELGANAFKIVLIGDGEDRAFLQKMAHDLRLDNIAYFLGSKENPYPYYAIADVLVLSSDLEGFGNVLIEAMGCGVPVISTDCPSGPAEILENGKWGVLIPRRDPAALAAELRRVLEDDEYRLNLGEKSVARAKEYDCKNFSKNFEKILRF